MKQNEFKQAVVYCRVSSQKQTTVGDGLGSQETRCREFARMKGYDVLSVFVDDVSGSLTERPGMKEMLSFIRKRRTNGVVVIIDDVSRLARGLQAHLDLRAAISNAGGKLESPSIEFGEDPDSILVENLLASVSQHQRQKNGEQTKNRMRARVQNGYHVFQAPTGFVFRRVTGRGMMLHRDEPVASVVQEALEGYASGRFEQQADVMRFLQNHPIFPKDGTGIIRNWRVTQLLRQPAYAGYVEAPNWNVSLRPGQHEGLISFETYQQVLKRMDGGGYLPRRHNLNEDFPLRGFVVCAHCSTPLTACWSSGSHKRYPYYLCPTRGCESYGKSVRREKLEAEFADLIRHIEPTDSLFKVARRMFSDLWEHRLTQAENQVKALSAHLVKTDRQVQQLLERILDTSVPSVIAAYEDRIRTLEADKTVLKEKIIDTRRPKTNFDTALRTALEFLSSPWILWNSPRFEDKRTVLKLTFSSKLEYARNSGFRTANLTLPFKVLGSFCGEEKEMAHPKRFELLTPRFVVWCSIQLSYGCVCSGVSRWRERFSRGSFRVMQ